MVDEKELAEILDMREDLPVGTTRRIRVTFENAGVMGGVLNGTLYIEVPDLKGYFKVEEYTEEGPAVVATIKRVKPAIPPNLKNIITLEAA